MKIENLEKVIDYITNWIKENVEKANSNGVIVGNSGGVDSALVLALAKRVFPETTLGIVMPCYSPAGDKEDALLVGDSINVETEVVDLSSTYDELLKNVSYTQTAPEMALGNIKPRLRMTTLYFYAQTLGRLVLGTSNKSEITVGYFTKYGDGGADLLPIGSLTKYEVWELAKYLNVPEKIINKKPSAGIVDARSDEEEMGFTYDDLEKYIKGREKELSNELVNKIERLYKANEHKRNLPPSPPPIENLLE